METRETAPRSDRVRQEPRSARALVDAQWLPVAGLSPAERAGLWEVRRSRIRYAKIPDHQISEERAAFLASLDRWTHCALGRSADGRPSYFALFRIAVAQGGDPLSHLIELGPHYRRKGVGVRGAYLGVCRTLLWPLVRRPLRSQLVVLSNVSPLGYARLLRGLEGVAPLWIFGEQGAPPRLRRAFEAFVQEDHGALMQWDPETQFFRWPIQVDVDRESLERSGLSAANLRRFIARIPDPLGLNAGHTVPVGTVFSVSNGLAFTAVNLRDRLVPRGRRREPDDLGALLDAAAPLTSTS